MNVVNSIADDGLATQGARASTAMVLTYVYALTNVLSI